MNPKFLAASFSKDAFCPAKDTKSRKLRQEAAAIAHYDEALVKF
jgi:hypothetical protein